MSRARHSKGHKEHEKHRAAGGEPKDRPPLFFARKEASDLIDALLESLQCAIEPLRVVNGGPERGTYVVKELVYAYATRS